MIGVVLLPLEVEWMIRDFFVASRDTADVLVARLVSPDWRKAAVMKGNPLVWCSRLVKVPVQRWRLVFTFEWPFVEGGQFPFDLPPFVLEVLLENRCSEFRALLEWKELAELARRMLRSKDGEVEKKEREAWFKL